MNPKIDKLARDIEKTEKKIADLQKKLELFKEEKTRLENEDYGDIVAMVFFSAVFAARTPAMGNSADRAWQLSQLVEGVSTAFNPSRDSLSYVQAGHCVSKQIGRHDEACHGYPRCAVSYTHLTLPTT